MKRGTDIHNEIKQISELLANEVSGKPYALPVGYFESLHWKVMGRLNGAAYSVPPTYFEELHGNIMQRITAEETLETDNIPALLQNLPKQNVYNVPVDYFENTNIPTETKVVPLKKTQTKRNWWRVAAAACATGIVASGIYFAVNNGSSNTSTANAKQTVIEGTGGLTYKQIQEINIDKELDKLNEAEVDKYLCEEGLIACAEKPAADAIEKELEKLEITDEDLDKALEEL